MLVTGSLERRGATSGATPCGGVSPGPGPSCSGNRVPCGGVEFSGSGHRVGMRAKELCTLDHLPDEVLALLGERAAQLDQIR